MPSSRPNRRRRRTKVVAAASRRIYHFADGRADGDASMRELLGNKGANLADMTRAGLPVPPGFTITSAVCREYLAKGRKWPRGLDAEIDAAVARLERATKKRFGDAARPLLVAVRSGASVSMPGMMDTILNVGLTDAIVPRLARDAGDVRFAHDSYRRLLSMFGSVVGGARKHVFEDAYRAAQRDCGAAHEGELVDEDFPRVVEHIKATYADAVGEPFPQDPRRQLRRAIAAVFDSWNSERAVAHRKRNGLDDLAGTAVTVQAMAFGNLGDDSATGVAFTRDPSTGEDRLYGEFLVNAQGEDIVGGGRSPHDCATDMPRWSEPAWRELLRLKTVLERRYRDMQDFEFTIERGRLFLLQTRTGKRTARAAVRIATEMSRDRLIDEDVALSRVDPLSLDHLLRPTFDAGAVAAAEVIATGKPASPGAASGRIAFRADDAERRARLGERVILVRPETDAHDVAGMFAAAGVLTLTGGMTSHAALEARGMGRPCVVDAASLTLEADALIVGGRRLGVGDTISLDGSTGHVWAGALPMVDADLAGPFETIMRLADRRRAMRVLALATSDDDLARAARLGADGALLDTRLMPRPHATLPAIARPFRDRRLLSFAAGPSGATLTLRAGVEANAASPEGRARRVALDVLIDPASLSDVLKATRGIRGGGSVVALVTTPRDALTADAWAATAPAMCVDVDVLGRHVFGDETTRTTLDLAAVGRLIRLTVDACRAARPTMPIGLFGVALGDPAAIRFAVEVGATWIAVPPLRVPLARLAAAQAAGPGRGGATRPSKERGRQ